MLIVLMRVFCRVLHAAGGAVFQGLVIGIGALHRDPDGLSGCGIFVSDRCEHGHLIGIWGGADLHFVPEGIADRSE